MNSIGVDIGGTNARAALVERSGKLLAAAKRHVADGSPEAIARTIAALIEEIAPAEPASTTVGVGIAGMLSGEVVVNAPNLGWRDVAFGSLLEGLLKRRVQLANDLSAAAWGEFRAGAARGSSDSLTVFVGTGVGSAIITQGRLVTGATGVAGELGHIKVVAQGGRRCGCGEHGCLEAYAGGAKLTEWMHEEGLAGTPADLERLAAAGDPTALRLHETAAQHLGLAIANQVTVLNPAVVVLGGGVLAHSPRLLARVTDFIASRATETSRRGLKVEPAVLGDDSGLIGAALLASGT